MPRIIVTLSPELTAELKNRAKKTGLPVSGYIRQILQDKFHSKDSQDQDKKEQGQKEVLFAIEALIPIFVEALAQTSSKVPPEERIERVIAMLRKKWKAGVGGVSNREGKL